MGKRNKQYENQTRFGRCEICNNEIPIEFYFDKGEVVFCNECSSEYIIKSLRPVRLMLINEDYGDDGYLEMAFN